MVVKNVEKLEKSMVSMEIEVGAEELNAAVEKAYRKLRNRISVPGFRRGKAPRHMIEKLYGADVFYSDAIEEAVPEAYKQAVKEQKLEPINTPAYELLGTEPQITPDGFTFKATVAVYPEVKSVRYKGVSAPKQDAEVRDEDIQLRLNEMAERNARLVSADRPAELGDTVVIDFEGFMDGKPFDGGSGENQELELGAGQFVPGFEDQIVGMSAGEEKDIDITFPENYQKDLAGKPAQFHINVSEVKFKELPELDDEFAKDVSEFDTLEELKEDTRKQLVSERELQAKTIYENALMEKAAETLESDIPDVLIENQCHRFLEEFKAQISAQGIPYTQYVKMTNMDERKFLEDAREPAIRQVKLDLTIAHIIDVESLTVSEEEINAEYDKLATQYGMSAEMVRQYLDLNTIRTQVLNNKAIAVVVENAVPYEESGEESDPDENQPENADGKSE